jgi:hypothetical protein
MRKIILLDEDDFYFDLIDNKLPKTIDVLIDKDCFIRKHDDMAEKMDIKIRFSSPIEYNGYVFYYSKTNVPFTFKNIVIGELFDLIVTISTDDIVSSEI